MPFEGSQFGRYHLHHMLGSGGMGEVYLAEDTLIHRLVALKVIRSELQLALGVDAAQHANHLFERELQIIAHLDHPHILPLYDYGTVQVHDTSLMYLVMPYLSMGSLLAWMRQRSALRLRQTSILVKQAASALQYAHDQRVIHRDIKPSNFLVRLRAETPDQPDLLLADFGISRFLTTTSQTSQTIQGTPTYTAPEQWEGHPTIHSDQYALAVMAYELLVGRPPFEGGASQLMYQHLTKEPPAPEHLNPALSPEAGRILLHALAKHPGERFTSVTAFATALDQAILEILPESTVLAFEQPSSPPLSENGQSKLYGFDEQDVTTATSLNAPVQPTVLPSALPPTQAASFGEQRENERVITQPVASSPGPRDTLLAGASAFSHPRSESGNLPPELPETPPGSILIPPTDASPMSRKRGKSKKWLGGAIAALAILIVGISITFFPYLSSLLPENHSRNLLPTDSTTSVTATTAETVAPTATPIPTLRQLSATQSASQTVNASGQETISQATYATGTIYFINGINPNSPASSVPAGTVLTNNGGCGDSNLQVVTDATVSIPAGDSWPMITIDAHSGNAGNFAQDCSASPGDSFVSCFPACDSNQSWSAHIDSGFTNGHDAVTASYVLQSDITSAAAPLISSTTLQAQNSLQQQMRPQEHLTGAPQCQSSTSANHAAGDQASTVTVTVTTTCTAMAST